MTDNHDYEDGLREGRLQSLEAITKLHTNELNKIKIAMWMLYGAIALVSFMPAIREFILSGSQ